MNTLKRLLSRPTTRRGFTLIELMMVVTVMAVVAGLATAAAVHSVKQSRVKRINATCATLQMAIMNYRAREEAWPWAGHEASTLAAIKHDDTDSQIIFSGQNNNYVFEELIDATARGTPYLDASAILVDKVIKNTKTGRTSRILRDAIASGKTSGLALGYMDAKNSSLFHYFKVIYNIPTDSVAVTTE